MADVKIDYDARKAYFTSEKKKGVYVLEIQRAKHPLFVFKPENGPVPEELKGGFTSIKDAMKAFDYFERVATKSRTVRRDEWQEEKEAKRAKLSSENS